MKPDEIDAIVDDLKEKLASIEHDRWAAWQRYMHDKCTAGTDGTLLIPAHLVARWKEQISTPYDRLPDKQKQSDRDQVDRYLPLVRAAIKSAALGTPSEPADD